MNPDSVCINCLSGLHHWCTGRTNYGPGDWPTPTQCACGTNDHQPTKPGEAPHSPLEPRK